MENHTDHVCEGAHELSPLLMPPGLAAALGVIGGKWKPRIMWHLAQRERRFGELRRVIPRITQHMLTLHLRELEADGIISRTVYAEVPPRVVYAITDHGQSLAPVLRVLFEWGVKHLQLRGSDGKFANSADPS